MRAGGSNEVDWVGECWGAREGRCEVVEKRLNAEEGNALALRNPVAWEGESGSSVSSSSSSSSTCALSGPETTRSFRSLQTETKPPLSQARCFSDGYPSFRNFFNNP